MFKNLSNRELEDLLLTNFDKNEKTKSNACPECNSCEFIEDYSKGMILCYCGQVIDNIFDNKMEDKFDDGNNDMPKNGMYHNKLLPQSSLGTMINARGRIRQLHIWNAMPYKERSNNIMFKRIHMVCIANKICKKIEDDAKILCKHVSDTSHKEGKNKDKLIITRGCNRSGIVAGCLFIACRRNNETRAPIEIAQYFNMDEKDVNKGLRSLLEILDDENIIKDIGTSRVTHFIKRKCDSLNITNTNTMLAATIAENIDKLNIASNYTTYSLASATILLMGEICNDKSITKEKISEIFCGLSEMTIIKAFKQLRQLKNVLINNDKVNEIHKIMLLQKGKKLISKKVYDHMVKFGINTSKYTIVTRTK